MGCSLFFASDFLSSKRALRHPAFPATIGQHDGPASRQALARSNDPHLGGETADGSRARSAALFRPEPRPSRISVFCARDYALETLADSDAVLVIDETG